MPDTKDYTTWALEALLAEEKKIRKQETIAAVIIGFLIGVIIYGVATRGIGFLYIFIPVILIIAIYRNSQNLKQKLKQVQAEIAAKSTR